MSIGIQKKGKQTNVSIFVSRKAFFKPLALQFIQAREAGPGWSSLFTLEPVMFYCFLSGGDGQWSGYSRSTSITKHRIYSFSTKKQWINDNRGHDCSERRGGQGRDKVNRMTEEAIAPNKKNKNQYTFTMFVLIAISHQFKKLAALECSLLMLCKFHDGFKKQIGMASQKRGETLHSGVTCCKGAWLNLV